MNNKKVNMIAVGLFSMVLQGTAFPQAQKFPVLDALQACDVAAIQKIKAPVKLSNGLIVTKIQKSKDSMGVRIELDFNKAANPNKENQAGMVKRLTGYDFTDLDSHKYEIDEADGNPWIVCRAKK